MNRAIALGLLLAMGFMASADDSPTASITNGIVHATLNLPDVQNGYYQGMRFDWAGSIASLEADGHTYWGQWFPRKDPTRQDSITGPVEVFGPLNYEESKPGGTFVKIGVGTLRRADERPYSAGSHYDFVDHGKWSVRSGSDFVEFRHELSDPKSGYAYVYTKTVRLTPGKPQMTISHSLRNTGVKAISTDVYNHGFFMLDAQPTGPAVTITFPFEIKGGRDMNGVAEVRDTRIIFLKEVEDVIGADGTPGTIPAAPGRGGPTGATAMTPVEGFSQSPKDFNIALENHKSGAGVRITGDRPLSRFNFWSIRRTIGPEPYVDVKADPGKETSWRLTYDFFTVPSGSTTAALTSCPVVIPPTTIDGKPAPVAGGRAFEPKKCEVEGLPIEVRPPELDTDKPLFPNQTRAPFHKSKTSFKVTVVTDKLDLPWGMQFLPDGKILVTEKPGAIRIVAPDGTVSEPVKGLPPVAYSGDAGLLDVALDPAFARNHLIYFNYFEPLPYDRTRMVLAKANLDEAGLALNNVIVIWTTNMSPPTIPSNNGDGRIAFAKDGTLFMSVGDRNRGNWDLAQRLDTNLGKIIHITSDGAPASDNPFIGKRGALPEVWSYGHRTPEGLTFDSDGRLWETENGPRGGDELNLIQKGANYGWPVAVHGIDYSGKKLNNGTTDLPDVTQPIYYWDPVIAPSGLTFYHGKMFPEWEGSVLLGGLRGKMLDRLTLKNDRVVSEEPLLVDMNRRIRDVRVAPDGAVYVLTDEPKVGKILKLTAN